jgi:hypothetical protein
VETETGCGEEDSGWAGRGALTAYTSYTTTRKTIPVYKPIPVHNDYDSGEELLGKKDRLSTLLDIPRRIS